MVRFLDLIKPLTKEEFINKHIGKEKLFLEPLEFDPTEILSITEISDYLARRDISTHSLTMHGNDITANDYTYELSDVPENKFIDNEKMFSQFCQGARIRIYRPDLIFNNLYYFTKQIERDFNTLVNTHMFITPPNKDGIGIHHDPNDLFAIQFTGKKQWLIYEPQLELPLASKIGEYNRDTLYPPSLEIQETVDAKTGSLFFLPRGLPHRALSVDEISIHVSFSLKLTTYHDVFKRIAMDSAHELQFRKVANSYKREWSDDKRLAFFENMFEDFSNQSTWIDVDSFRSSCFKQRRKEFKNAFLDLSNLDKLNKHSKLITRDIHIRFVIREEFLSLNFYYKKLKFPAKFRTLIKTILESKQFIISEICPEFSVEHKLALCSELIQEGLLTFSLSSNGLHHDYYHPYKIVDHTNNKETYLV